MAEERGGPGEQPFPRNSTGKKNRGHFQFDLLPSSLSKVASKFSLLFPQLLEIQFVCPPFCIHTAISPGFCSRSRSKN